MQCFVRPSLPLTLSRGLYSAMTGIASLFSHHHKRSAKEMGFIAAIMKKFAGRNSVWQREDWVLNFIHTAKVGLIILAVGNYGITQT